MSAHHTLVAFRGCAFRDDVAFAGYGREINFSVVAVSNTRDEKLELVIGRKRWHFDGGILWIFGFANGRER